MDNGSSQNPTFSPTVHEHRFVIPPVVKWVGFFLIFIIGIILGAILMSLFDSAKAPKQTLTVQGVGIVQVPANKATLSIYENNGTTSGSSSSATLNDQLMGSLIGMGVSQANIQNSDGTITITLDKGQLSLIKKIISVADTYFPNSIAPLDGNGTSDGVSYAITGTPDLTSYKTQARTKALQDAANQANKIGQVNNKKLGRITEIKDVTDNSQNPYPGSSTNDTSYLDTPYATLTQTYSVTYEEQ